MPSVGEATPRARAWARRAAPATTSAESSPPVAMPSSSRCASAGWPERCSRPAARIAGARGKLRLVGDRHAGEALDLPRPAAGDVGHHAGVERVQHAEAVALHRGTQGRQRLLGLAAAELRPGEQHRLHELHRPAAGEAAQPLLRPVPAPGLRLRAGQQQVGDRVVRQAAGEPQRFAPPVEQGGEESAVEQFRLVRVGPAAPRGDGRQPPPCRPRTRRSVRTDRRRRPR